MVIEKPHVIEVSSHEFRPTYISAWSAAEAAVQGHGGHRV